MSTLEPSCIPISFLHLDVWPSFSMISLPPQKWLRFSAVQDTGYPGLSDSWQHPFPISFVSYILWHIRYNSKWDRSPLFFFFFFFFFLLFRAAIKAHEVPRLGIKLEMQLPAYTTAIATLDPTHIFNLYCSSRQHWILNPLSKARVQTCIFMDTSQVHFHWATMGTPISFFNQNLTFKTFFGHTYGRSC